MIAYGFEESNGALTGDVERELGDLERHGDMTLGGEVVDLARLDLIDQASESLTVGHVAVVEDERRSGSSGPW